MSAGGEAWAILRVVPEEVDASIVFASLDMLERDEAWEALEEASDEESRSKDLLRVNGSLYVRDVVPLGSHEWILDAIGEPA